VRKIEEITGVPVDAIAGGAEPQTGACAAPQSSQSPQSLRSPRSPGLLKSHYAPQTPLFLYEAGLMPVWFAGASGKKALVFYAEQTEAVWKTAARRAGIHVGYGGITTYTLSNSGDSREAAAALFDLLFHLDKGGFAAIHAEKAPRYAAGDLANAINDRLTKASNRCIMEA
jgi:L-threonylcarbamoyladenylate synthase